MASLAKRVERFLRSEDGPTATEYAVWLAIFVVALLVITQPLQDAWVRIYGQISTEVGNTV